ncbi:MAG: aminodeoxychorismate synthase component I [Flavobacteriaceae bacterium]|nr:aminodeoxychorismate synthase component I [Flavobacteriaceae bacterium]|tara:strand:+ start:110 stop:1408 length:1299 start_codon:yes stop_codon:yes gene_type:complete
MNRTVKTFSITLTQELKEQLLHWAQQFHEVVWLDSNEYAGHNHTYEAILAVDAATAVKTDSEGAFRKLDEYQRSTNDWIFGYLSYDLKNDVERLTSENFDGLLFPELYFFQPKRLFLFTETDVELHYLSSTAEDMATDWKNINSLIIPPTEALHIKLRARTSRASYLEKATAMLQHIERGDIYEANLCQEFYADNSDLDPLNAFFHLNSISSPPFATFLKLEGFYALSASPERYLSKIGSKVVSQPIKGTARRHQDPKADSAALAALERDPKERSENIMITDLVRNDLSRIAEKGSVRVDELCKGYTFKQVHQLISTISCNTRPDISAVEVLAQTFPMGSMTGAPKISAMKIIEKLEDAKRGLYSGAIGYITPTGDFDFNVVIRSILFNADKKYVSFSVGGAITAKSLPIAEYEECLVKAAALRKVLENKAS